jgi:uncharacterized phage-like protein YoqJ
MVDIISFSGHRPPKAGFTWSHDSPLDHARVEMLRERLRGADVQAAVVGGAQGWDTLAARACHLEGIRYHVFVPFTGQELQWPQQAQERYRAMLAHAYSVRVVSPGPYAPWKMQKRNEAMVNHSLELWACWDGSPGGTANCVAYAQSVGVPVINLLGEE